MCVSDSCVCQTRVYVMYAWGRDKKSGLSYTLLEFKQGCGILCILLYLGCYSPSHSLAYLLPPPLPHSSQILWKWCLFSIPVGLGPWFCWCDSHQEGWRHRENQGMLGLYTRRRSPGMSPQLTMCMYNWLCRTLSYIELICTPSPPPKGLRLYHMHSESTISVLNAQL